MTFLDFIRLDVSALIEELISHGGNALIHF